VIALGIVAVLLAAASPEPVPAAAPPAPLPALPISGALLTAPAALDAAARARLPRTSVSATDPDKQVATYAGVSLASALRDAGAPLGDALRGASARAYVIVGAADGYSAVFALGELQTTAPACAPLVADARDGAPLDAKSGPLRIVAPCDVTHARWVRGVTSLTIVVAPGKDAGMH
jgi:hypothetical protein